MHRWHLRKHVRPMLIVGCHGLKSMLYIEHYLMVGRLHFWAFCLGVWKQQIGITLYRRQQK